MARLKQQQQKGQAQLATQETGVVWVSSTGVTWQEEQITVEKLRKYSNNVYGAGIAHKQRLLIFTGQPKVTVKDESGDVDQDLTNTLTTMGIHPDVLLGSLMYQAWEDIFWYGLSVFNPIWDWVDGEYRLMKVRHLTENPESFTYPALTTSASINQPKNLFFQGIVLGENDSVEYWQVPDIGNNPVKLAPENLFVVTDPAKSPLSAQPTILPVVKVIAMLDYVWQAQMQKCHRTGAPLLFIRIKTPKTSSQLGGQTGDVEYAKLVLKNWGKNTGYALRENMELVDPYLRDTSDNLETIDALNRLVLSHFSPSSFIAKDGTLIGGSSAPEQELLISYVNGIQSWLEYAFNRLLQVYLDANGYQGYTVSIDLPDLKFDRSELEMKQAEVGDRMQCLTLNEKRALLHHEPADEEKQAAIQAEYAERAPIAQPMPFGNTGVGHTHDHHNVRKRQGTSIARIRQKTTREMQDAYDRCRDDILKAIEGL
jgi:hypothetical protein